MKNPNRFICTLCLCCCLFIETGIFAQPYLPANDKATKETKALYLNLQQVLGKGVLFGHQDDLAYGIGWSYVAGNSDVKKVTGDYPALYGWELGNIELGHAKNLDSVPFAEMKKFILQGYKQG
jgi:Glycosyl hydrolase family 26